MINDALIVSTIARSLTRALAYQFSRSLSHALTQKFAGPAAGALTMGLGWLCVWMLLSQM